MNGPTGGRFRLATRASSRSGWSCSPSARRNTPRSPGARPRNRPGPGPRRPPHLPHGSATRVLVADLAELARPDEMWRSRSNTSYIRLKVLKTCSSRPSYRRHLQPLVVVQPLPKVDRGGEDDVGVADDMDELRVGEHLQQRPDAGGVRRRLQHDPLGIPHVTHLRNQRKPRLPARQRLPPARRASPDTPGIAADGSGTRSSDTARGRPCCTGRTRPPAGGPSRPPCCPSAAAWASRNLQARLHPPARHEKMVRREAGVGVGIGVPRVEHQQFVQQRRAGTPMADHEDRIVARSWSARSSARAADTGRARGRN